MKVAREPKQNRTKIGSSKVFPEEADREIMSIVKLLAAQTAKEKAETAQKEADKAISAKEEEAAQGGGGREAAARRRAARGRQRREGEAAPQDGDARGRGALQRRGKASAPRRLPGPMTGASRGVSTVLRGNGDDHLTHRRL